MSDFITKLSDMIDPEVMGDMVSARIPKKLRVAPFAKIDAGFSRFSAKRSRYPIRSNAARSGATGTLPVPAA